MTRVVTILAIAALGIGSAWAAPDPKADCRKFKRTSDGRWISTVDSKVGNPKNFIVLQAGKPIERDLTVVGVNVSDTIDRLCGN